MPRRNDAWGIEVGANAIKAVRLSRSGSDVVLKDFEILPFKQILTTPDLNVEELIQVGLDTLLSKHDVGHSTVVVSVPGHMGFARFAKLPPVEPKKIPDIVRFEAVQQIPFPIEQVEWDYQVFQQADSPDVEVGIFAITKERVLNYLSNFRQVNMRVDALTQSPLAMYNAFAFDRVDENDDGVIYMDIGTRSTDVVIAEQGQILPRTLPIGGNHFTEALVKAFKLSFPKAEKLKREAGTSKYARQIFQAMRPVFADLVQELQRSLGYYQSINRDANLTKLVGVGSTFRLPGLQKFLKQQLQIEVIRPDGFQRIAAEGKREAEFTEHALNMATAYGLAIQGLGMETVTANLLPRNILTQRMWRAKQPWFAAAAACLAVAAGAMVANHVTVQRTYQSQYEQTAGQISPILSQARDNSNEWRDVASGADPRDQIENLRRLLDYRDVWPKLMEDLSHAANAVNPDPADISSDYSEMESISRDQRRRIFIDEVEASYAVGSDGADSPAGGARRQPAGRGGGGRGGMDRYGMDGGGGGRSGDEMSGGSVSDFFNDNDRPPRFVITLRGTTPHRDGAAFISNHFLRWLQDNADRPDRPYRIVVNMGQAIRSMDQIRESDVDSDQRGATRGRAAAQRGMDEFEDSDMLDRTTRTTTRTTRGRGGDALAATLPERPVAAGGQAGDWRFEIQWEVELRSPSEARSESAPDDTDVDDAPEQPEGEDDPRQAQQASDPDAATENARREDSERTAIGEEARS
ncbi:type IV pilus assembly protein PilM [Phycisphaerales bacterium AB-hyl4]|uniref:Type IV pilus assembly protein PilM n=1 Tax=Natronomicrosphaera hydrolytica TaxID=3242702 RepID=A0ABV4U1W4_9BACT